MKKIESGKAKTPASKPLAKTVAKASPAQKAVKTVAKKAAAPAKKSVAKKAAVKSAPAKKATAPVKKAPVAKKASVKAAPAKKSAPAKKATAPVKKAPVAKKAAAVSKDITVKKFDVKAAPAVKVSSAAKAVPAKKAVVKVPAKPVSKTVLNSGSAKKKADKNRDIQASHHGRIVTKAEVAAFQNLAEANGHVIRKSHFSAKMKKHYRDLLLDLRANYQDQLNIHRADALTNRKSGPGAGMATHMADLGSDNFQHDFELGLLSDEGTVIEMIDEALTRLDENEYGICIECGNEISPARLEVKPYARFCVACKSRKEASEGMRRR